MARDARRHQKALQRKAAKRKEKLVLLRSPTPPSDGSLVRIGATWPIHEVLVTSGWDERSGQLVEILVSRMDALGRVAAAVFLVDLGCLGVKNAFAATFPTRFAYHEKVRDQLVQERGLVGTDFDLAAKIVAEAIEYARELGFEPHRDFREARLLLAGSRPEACATVVPLGGTDGKPYFISGPYDDVPRILATLARSRGPEGFHVTATIEDDLE